MLRAYAYVRTLGALGPTRQLIARNRDLTAAYQELQGFENALFTEDDFDLRRELASDLASLQNVLYIRGYLGDDIGQITSVETQVEYLRLIDRTAKKIATDLENCCEKLDALLNEIKADIPTQTNELIKYFDTKFETQLVQIKQLFDQLGDLLSRSFTELFNEIKNVKETLSTELQEKINALFEKLKKEFEVVSALITAETERIINYLSIKFDLIQTVLGDILGIVTSIEASVAAIGVAVGELASTVTALGIELNELIVFQHNETRGRIALCETNVKDTIAVVSERINTLQNNNYLDLKQTLAENTESITTSIKEAKDEILKSLDEGLEKISIKVINEVCNSVGGESYLKWDSVSFYFPTLTFVFNELNVTRLKRRTQIKTRLPKKSEEITKEDVLALKNTILRFQDWTYNYGPLRANYVSTDKRWKTTVFLENEIIAKEIFNQIGAIIGEAIDFDLLSFTQLKKRRPRLTTRNAPLDDINLNSTNYDEVFSLDLKRAVLMVNNLERPIQVFP